MQKEAAAAVGDIDVRQVADVNALLTLYENRFCTQESTDLAKSEFRNSYQSDDESILSWHGRCRDLFKRAFPHQNVDDYAQGENLRDHFCKRLANREICQQVLMNRPATWHDCLRVAQNASSVGQGLSERDGFMEQIPKNRRAINQIQNPATNDGSIGAFGPPKDGGKGKGTGGANPKKKKDNTNKDCYNCGDIGHIKWHCPKPRREGFHRLEGPPKKGGGGAGPPPPYPGKPAGGKEKGGKSGGRRVAYVVGHEGGGQESDEDEEERNPGN